MFGVSAATASRVFNSTINVLYKKLKFTIKWPTREELKKTMPMEFKNAFGEKLACIIDCFEVFIDRPSNLLARLLTWSNYKHHNTIKILLGKVKVIGQKGHASEIKIAPI